MHNLNPFLSPPNNLNPLNLSHILNKLLKIHCYVQNGRIFGTVGK